MSDKSIEQFSITHLFHKITILLGILIPAAGLYYNFTYYRTFDINITDFIDLSESFMMFIPKLRIIQFIILFAIPIINYYIYIHCKPKYLKYAIPYLLSIAFVFWRFYKHSAPVLVNEFKGFYISMWALMAISTGLPYLITKTLKNRFKLVSFIYLATISIITVIWFCDLNSLVVSNYKRFSSVQLTLEDNTIYSTDTTNIYIGQTRHYLFIWNKNTHVATAYLIDKANKIEYRR